VPAPGGPAGVSDTCNVGEINARIAEARRPKWRSGAGFAHSSTRVRFSNADRAGLARSLVTTSVEHRPSPKWTVQGTLGMLLGGELVLDDGAAHDFDPGLVTAFTGAYRLVDGTGAAPFVLLGGTLSWASASTHARAPGAGSIGYNAFDLRFAVTVGKTIARSVSPYLTARAFGGPIFWRVRGEAVTGTDLFKYQLGGGLVVTIARRVDAFVEGIAFGERAIVAGAGIAF
jgi:hypothetical protein